MMRANYTVEGSAVDGQTYVCEGTVTDAEITAVMTAVLLNAFKQLTNGKAVFGKPGVGCRGPYKITRVEVKIVEP